MFRPHRPAPITPTRTRLHGASVAARSLSFALVHQLRGGVRCGTSEVTRVWKSAPGLDSGSSSRSICSFGRSRACWPSCFVNRATGRSSASRSPCGRSLRFQFRPLIWRYRLERQTWRQVSIQDLLDLLKALGSDSRLLRRRARVARGRRLPSHRSSDRRRARDRDDGRAADWSPPLSRGPGPRIGRRCEAPDGAACRCGPAVRAWLARSDAIRAPG